MDAMASQDFGAYVQAWRERLAKEERVKEAIMSSNVALARRICEQAQGLPEMSLVELERYVEFLRFRAGKSLTWQEQLVSDYDELAASYDEPAADLADEVWLPLEYEALLRAERQVPARLGLPLP